MINNLVYFKDNQALKRRYNQYDTENVNLNNELHLEGGE